MDVHIIQKEKERQKEKREREKENRNSKDSPPALSYSLLQHIPQTKMREKKMNIGNILY